MCKFHLRGGYVTKEDDVVDEIRGSAPAGPVVPRYHVEGSVGLTACHYSNYKGACDNPEHYVCEWFDVQAALTAAQEARQQAEPWQPIDTAPMDGSVFRAYGPTLIHEDFNPSGSVEACFDGERLIGAVWDGQHDMWRTDVIEATHWMPLPKHPLARLPIEEGTPR